MRSLPIILAGAVLAAGALPAAAEAQAPSYAAAETIHGTISAVRDLTHLVVDDDRGFIDNVTLRSSAIVPGGVRLEPGQRVTIDGAASGPTFLATQIATSGRSADYAAVDAPRYYPAPVAYYPAPVFYPAPYYYRAPSIGLFFHFR
jgi:hypothetical protein